MALLPFFQGIFRVVGLTTRHTGRRLIYNQNKVPMYQRYYQRDDGKRLWQKHPRSRMLLLPYFAMVSVGLFGGLYGLTRMSLGKKTFY